MVKVKYNNKVGKVVGCGFLHIDDLWPVYLIMLDEDEHPELGNLFTSIIVASQVGLDVI